ncbi:MAG: hypothetical protein ACRDUW_10890 [Pseudonocardiaceae bacterium]
MSQNPWLAFLAACEAHRKVQVDVVDQMGKYEQARTEAECEPWLWQPNP